MQIGVQVKYDLSALKQALSMESALPFIAKAYEAWATIYRAAMQERFVAFSRGGGNWPELSPRTLLKKRRGGKSAAILRDTGILFGTLNPTFGQPGQHQFILPNGVEVGFSEGSSYSDGSSVADIARYHQFGMGHNPVREILVQPSDKTIQLMGDVMVQAIGDALNA